MSEGSAQGFLPEDDSAIEAPAYVGAAEADCHHGAVDAADREMVPVGQVVCQSQRTLLQRYSKMCRRFQDIGDVSSPAISGDGIEPL